ncbi:MAG: hypothetical protein KatS3mg129_0905 [Leptospiraceae bacterium]|nr:MAG: hypothetical protein KatS3mg129_0905 [Leptospiraceae bacterium]
MWDNYILLLQNLGLLNRNRRTQIENQTRSIEQNTNRKKQNQTITKKNIIFNDISNIDKISKEQNLSLKEFENYIKDLQDPLTGDPIQLISNQYLYQCKKCSVFYLKESFDFIKIKNQGKCVSCNGTNIQPYFFDGKVVQVINFNPEFVTLENLSLYVNKSIKFKGTVIKILESRRGDYALMFEDKPWVEGFKLIVFYPLMKPGKGLEREFLRSLVGKTITVRGLLQYHEIFGYEILIFKRNMILNIE